MEQMKNLMCDCIERKVVCNCLESFSSNVNALPSGSAKEPPINQLGESSDPNENVLIPPLPQTICKSLTWEEVRSRTENGDKKYFIGKGGFGTVYRCKFGDMDVAVKVQRKREEQLSTDEFSAENQRREDQLSTDEFNAEVQVLVSANHPNVIKLVGKCDEDGNRALIYEFMSGGSVESYILKTSSNTEGPSALKVVNWDVRQRIVVGVAKALVYLHGSLKWVHSDIKAANVLLDNDFEPKLADFGLARKVCLDGNGAETEITIDVIKGTRGWIAPETEEQSIVSTKSDVYSYGVFLLQLYTGRKPWDENRSPQKLADWVLERAYGREDYEREIVDTALGDVYSVQGFKKILAIAVKCIDATTYVRPTMNEVLQLVCDAFSDQRIF